MNVQAPATTMKRRNVIIPFIRRRNLFALLALLFLAFAVAALSIDRKHYARFVRDLLISSLPRNEALVTVHEPNLTFLGITAEHVDIVFRNFPFALRASPMALRIKLRALALLQAAFVGEASLYKGALSAHFDRSLISGSTSFQVALRDLSLAAHPQLLGLGITEGTLSFSFEGQTTSDLLHALKGQLTLSGLTKPMANSFVVKSDAGKFPVSIPPILGLSLEGKISLHDGRIFVQDLKSRSSLLDLDGALEFELGERPHLRLGDLQVSLHEAHRDELRLALAFFCSGVGSAAGAKFALHLEGAPSQTACRALTGGIS